MPRGDRDRQEMALAVDFRERGVGPAASPPTRRRSARAYCLAAVITAAALALLALLGYGLLRQQGGSLAGVAVNAVGRAAPLRVRPAPDFTLPLFDGGTFRLSEQRGRVVVVNYWASWCPPCREEAAALEATWRAYRDRGVLLVGVNVWDAEPDARAFLRTFRVSYPNGPDDGSITIEYGLTGNPETYFVNRNGQLARRWIGPLTESQIAAFVEELLK